MLASAHRLRRSSDFAETVRGGRRAGRPAIVVHLLMGATTPQDSPAWTGEASPARAGFVVGKNVGSAVVRNRVRRRLRHAMRGSIKALPAGSRLVVRALPSAAATDFADLAGQVEGAIRSALAATHTRARGR